jgi:hypothetical protein
VPGSVKWYLSFMFSNHTPVCFFISHACFMSWPSGLNIHLWTLFTDIPNALHRSACLHETLCPAYMLCKHNFSLYVSCVASNRTQIKKMDIFCVFFNFIFTPFECCCHCNYDISC